MHSLQDFAGVGLSSASEGRLRRDASAHTLLAAFDSCIADYRGSASGVCTCNDTKGEGDGRRLMLVVSRQLTVDSLGCTLSPATDN